MHAPTGENIGHFVEGTGIFIDMSGRYLGEIIYDDRLMFNNVSPRRSTNYGNYGNCGNAGNSGNPGSYGSIGAVADYCDVEKGLMR